MKRHHTLHAPGTVLVNTDVHGNWADFSRMESIFHTLRQTQPEPVYWVILGDIVHGPDQRARERFPQWFDYDDESARIVERVIMLRQQYPEHVFFVLGNHDYAHIGGPHTGKFYPDEAKWLEAQMTPEAIERMHALFHDALLAITTDCGVLLCHGSPDVTVTSMARLDGIQLPARGEDHEVIHDMLWAYGQQEQVIEAVLKQISDDPSFAHREPLHVVLHGHDRDEDGFYYDDTNQVCPVIFGAPNANKRFAILDLSARYQHSEALVDGVVLRRLYPELNES